MFHGRKNNTNINNMHERCFRLIYKHKRSSYEKLLEMDGSASVHQTNAQVLEMETNKVNNDSLSNIRSDLISHILVQRHVISSWYQ